MQWTDKRNPHTPGLYGVLMHNDRSDPECFGFAYFDGTGWKMASQSNMDIAPYRPVKFWCKLEIGTDWNGYD